MKRSMFGLSLLLPLAGLPAAAGAVGFNSYDISVLNKAVAGAGAYIGISADLTAPTKPASSAALQVASNTDLAYSSIAASESLLPSELLVATPAADSPVAQRPVVPMPVPLLMAQAPIAPATPTVPVLPAKLAREIPVRVAVAPLAAAPSPAVARVTVPVNVPTVAVAAPTQVWEVKVSDVTLRRTLQRWARQAGWQVSWEVKIDYPVQLEAVYRGSFDSAVEHFTNALRGSDYPLAACFYDGNHVVRVMHFGDMKTCDSQKDTQ